MASRGQLMVSRSKARNQAPPLEDRGKRKEVITIKCFKCKFFTTNKNFSKKHMTLQHLMGRGHKKMEKFVALSTPNLLVSTLHRDEDEKGFTEDSDSGSKESEISGIDSLDNDLETGGNHDRSPERQISLNPGFLASPPVTTQQNFVTQTLNAENVRNVHEARGEQRVNNEQNDSERVGNHEQQQNILFDMAFLESPVATQHNFAENVENTQEAGNCRRSISLESMRNIPPPNNIRDMENGTYSPGTRGTQRPAQSTFFAENVTISPEGRNIQRTTSTGGIRNTPQRQAQKRNNAGRKNLYGGKKKMSNVRDIGQFNTKYNAHEKTKLLLKKHAKELDEHLLKLNNTEVDGIKNAENGFFIAYKSAGKTFVAREGTFGKMFVEDEEYRGSLIEEAKVIDVQLNNSVLTSMLKSQYGASKTQNTPKKHKRKDYKGVGAQTKKSKAVEANKESETVDVSVEPRSVQTSRKKTKSQKANTEDTPTHSDDSINNIISDTSGNSDNSWLRSMIHEETEPRKQINSKPAKKQARQLFPYKCSECPSKYKTQNGYEKHLREKHGLI